jgi:hypothetical protein
VRNGVERKNCQHSMSTCVITTCVSRATCPWDFDSCHQRVQSMRLSTYSSLQSSDTVLQKRRGPKFCDFLPNMVHHFAGCLVHAGLAAGWSKPSRLSRLALQHVEQVPQLGIAAALPCARPQHLQPRNTLQPLSHGSMLPKVLPRRALHV